MSTDPNRPPKPHIIASTNPEQRLKLLGDYFRAYLESWFADILRGVAFEPAIAFELSSALIEMGATVAISVDDGADGEDDDETAKRASDASSDLIRRLLDRHLIVKSRGELVSWLESRARAAPPVDPKIAHEAAQATSAMDAIFNETDLTKLYAHMKSAGFKPPETLTCTCQVVEKHPEPGDVEPRHELERDPKCEIHNGTRCPKCWSPNPRLHPAVQSEGEVELCTDPFHGGAK